MVPHSYFHPFRSTNATATERRFVPGLGFGKPGEHLTDRLTEEALHVIESATRRRQPFFLWLAHHAPHTPIEAPERDIARFNSLLKPNQTHRNPAYAALVGGLDESVGRVMARLRSLGIDRNTLVVFTSDNGGYIGTDSTRNIPVTSNAPLRSGKGSLYEGGLRVPLVIRWPGTTRAASRCEEPVLLTDLFPTLLAAAGVRPEPDDTRDALDLSPLLHNPAGSLGRETLFFHFPHYYHAPTTTPCGSLRTRQWKLIENFEDGRLELFDLISDPGETRDCAAEQPDLAARLRQQLATWRRDVGSRMPTPNPLFPATRP
jgi:arylsulfatase A-like enzyme